MSGYDSSVPQPSAPAPAWVDPDRESGLTLLTALLAIRRQLFVLVLTALLGVATGILVGLSQPTVYSSTAMLTVRPTAPERQLQMPPLAASYGALAKTDAVASRFRAATGATLTSEQLLERISVSTNAVTPDVFLTVQGGDAESAQVTASGWIQALIAQVDSTKGAIQPGGDLIVLAPPSEGVLTSSRSIAKSSVLGLCAGLLLGLAAALAVDAARQRAGRAAVAARRGVPVVFVSRGPTSPSALDDGARVVLAMLHPASAGPGRLVIVDLRNGPHQGGAADSVARTLASQGVPVTVLRSPRRGDPKTPAAPVADGGTTPVSGSYPAHHYLSGVTVLPVESSSSPARWALSAAGRKELAVLSQSQQVIINVPFGLARSDALAISASAPGVIVVAGPRTRAKDFDEALALLSSVSPKRLVAMITEPRGGRHVASRLRRPFAALRSARTAKPASAVPPIEPVGGDDPNVGEAPVQRVSEDLTTSQH